MSEASTETCFYCEQEVREGHDCKRGRLRLADSAAPNDPVDTQYREAEEYLPLQDPQIQCATFDKSGITPEVRARMDADRAKAEADAEPV